MIALILLAVLAVYVGWWWFVAVMAFRDAKNAGRLTRNTILAAYPGAIVGYLYDVLVLNPIGSLWENKMIAKSVVPSSLDMMRIVELAGGSSHGVYYEDGVLHVPGISQSALDTAVSTYTPPPKTLAELKRKAEQGELEAAKKLPLVKQLRRMSRADVLAAVDEAFPAGLQRDLIRQLAVVAWAGAVERDRNDD